MPELPEVETIRASLDPLVRGLTVSALHLRTERLRLPLDEGLRRAVVGRRIVATSRRGKYLLLHLDDGKAWIFHMGMSGRLRFAGSGVEPALHDHVVACFRTGGALVFHDPRRFGLCVVQVASESPLLSSMGPEPLDAGSFHEAYFASWRKRTTRTVKDVLMDQRVVAGLGNIYVNEILFRAGVRPRRSTQRLSTAECERIVAATREVISDAIEKRGSTISDFLDAAGRHGEYQHAHRVYDRAGSPCLDCGAPIRSVVVGQRSSFYCPRCQR